MLVLFPMMLCVVALAHDGLRMWLGADFAQHSYRVLQWLAVGVFLNSLALVPFTLLQAAGRPDLTATLHLIELPLYLGMLWWLISARGIEGAAIAWTVRMGIDAVFLLGLAKRLLPRKNPMRLAALLLLSTAILITALAVMLRGPLVKGLFLLVAILCFLLLTWFVALTPGERAFMWTRRRTPFAPE